MACLLSRSSGAVLLLLLALVLVPVAWQSFAASEDKNDAPTEPAAPLSDLTEDERTTALAVVREKLKERLAQPKVYLTGIEVLRDKEAERQKQRLALVTHYQTRGDVTILAAVNLTTKELISQEAIPHLATPLSKEEFDMAQKLARAQPDVQKLLASYGKKVEVQALVSRAALKTDPAFGHRVVHLLFRIGPDYLGTRVVVDLTTDEVTIEAPERRDQPKQLDHQDK